MAIAMSEPESQNRGGRGKKTEAVTASVSAKRIVEARFILRYAPQLAAQVTANGAVICTGLIVNTTAWCLRRSRH